MALVDYSDSEGEDAHPVASPPAKKRRVSRSSGTALPPLPAAFLDHYSGTVRTSTKDDPSLHGGRKRVTPHVEGNWPTHVYLEWHPSPSAYDLLSKLVSAVQPVADPQSKAGSDAMLVHSLLRNDLGVDSPLHISLSRPLVLKAEDKDIFLDRLKHLTNERGAKAVSIRPMDLAWHSNETKTRWFLVVHLAKSTQLNKLLEMCNDVAKEFQQPLLYAEAGQPNGDEFHISLGWSLHAPQSTESHLTASASSMGHSKGMSISPELMQQLSDLEVDFQELKVRIGQDVNVVRLKPKR